MPELSELFAQARDLNIDLNNEEQRNKAIEAIKSAWNPFYMTLTNIGFGAAQSRFDKDLKTEQGLRQKAENDLRELQQKIRDKQEPDIKQLNEQWQAKLDAETAKLKDQITKAEEKAHRIRIERDQKAYRQELVDRGVPPTLADALSKDPTLPNERWSYGEDDSLTVHQAGQKIPFAPAQNQSMLGLLADETVAKPDIKDLLVVKGERGAGLTTGASGGSTANGDKSFYDNIRNAVKEEVKENQPRVSLQERMKSR